MPVAKSARPAVTYLIAASDSIDKVKRIADYVCDGTADDVEIQAAINLCTAGGVIRFAPGTYNISTTLTSAYAITFEGSLGAIWYLVNGANCNMFQGVFQAFRHLQLDGNRGNQGATSHLIVGASGSDVIIENCLIWQGAGDGLRLIDPSTDMWTWRIFNTTFENFTNYGINIQQSNGARYFRNLQVSGGYFWNCRDGAIHLAGNSQNVYEVLVSHSRLGYSGDCLIELDDCKQIIISGNSIDSPGSNVGANDAGVYLNDCAEGIIADNVFWNSLSFVNGYGIDLQGTTNRVDVIGNTIYDANGAWLGPVNLGATNLNGAFRDNIGYIARGEVRSATGALASGNANAICFSWHNPEAQDILIKKVVVEVTTAGGTAGSHLDVGIADDAAGTNRGTEFFDDLNLNAAQVDDSWVGGDGGTQTKWVLCEDSASATDGWIVGQILDANAANLVGRYYVEYVGR